MSSGPLDQLEQTLERSIENVRQVRIVVSDFQPQGQPGLTQKLQQVVKDLAEIDKLRPSVADIQVPLEVFDYIDSGRNPQLYTKDCMEKAHSKNEEVKGKIDAYRMFKARLLIELTHVFPKEMAVYSQTGLRIAVVCSSNMNRSMEAHARLSKKGFNVLSFGTGDKVKLPGPSASQPNIYEFGTTYNEIWTDLVKKDEALYNQNGILHMLNRNKTIKPAPERLQDSPYQFDVILTAEERVFDQVLEHFEVRGGGEDSIVHVINMDIQDNQEEATIGAFFFHELVQMFSDSRDLDNEIDEMLQDFEIKCNRPLLHSVLFY